MNLRQFSEKVYISRWYFIIILNLNKTSENNKSVLANETPSHLIALNPLFFHTMPTIRMNSSVLKEQRTCLLNKQPNKLKPAFKLFPQKNKLNNVQYCDQPKIPHEHHSIQLHHEFNTFFFPKSYRSLTQFIEVCTLQKLGSH